MMFDEPLLRPTARPYISPSLSAPTISTLSSNGSPNLNPRFSPSPSSSYKNPRSSSSLPPSSSAAFSYNYRIAIALIPAAAFLLDLGGAPVAATLTLTLMIAYILDSLLLKSASFFAVWFALIASQIVFFFSSSPFSLFPSVPLSLAALLLCGETNFLVGVWASLQFRYILIENSAIVPALERLLFACVPIVGPPLFTWASVSATGLCPATAYHLAAFCAVSYWLFSLPRPSSFRSKQELARGRDAAGDESYILGPLESCVHTLNLLFLPVAFHVVSHHSTILSSASSVSDLLLLFFLPFLFLLYASTRGALWWVTRDGQQVHQIRVVNGAVALVVIVICLEIRVIFHAFGKYLHVPPPLNYLLVTIAMLGGASGVGAYALGMVNDAVSSVAFTALSILVSAAGAVVVGFPVYMAAGPSPSWITARLKLLTAILQLLPLPLISGFYLARFFTQKSPASYFAFVMLASLMVVWFVMHNFWDLNIWLAGMALKSSCKLIVASAILAMAVPGFVLLPRSLRFATELGLITYAFLLCYIENRLFNYTGIYFFGFEDEVVYPSYMVIVTTLLGLSLVRRLVVDQRIGRKAAWVATCLFSSKLAMLFITAKSVLWASAALLLAVSPPLLLYKDKSKATSRMKPWQGFAHASVIAFSAWLCRETIFEALQWWNGRPPSDGLLLGFYILSTGVACIPIVALHFSHVQSAKRFLVLVVAAGLLLIFMQPPIPWSWALESDMMKAAHYNADDFSIYGFEASKLSWPSWLLILSILLSLAAVTNIIPIKYIVELRAFYAVGVGIALGIYICVEYFPQAMILHALLLGTMISSSVFVVFTHLPSASSPRILPWVFALLVALFPVTYLLEGQLRVKSIITDEEGDKITTLLAVEGARMSLLGLYATLFMLIALEIKFELASLLHEKAAERASVSNQVGRGTVFAPKMRLIQQRKASTAPSFTVKKLAAEGSWMPAVGNVSTILCFVICLILNIHLTGGSNRAIFFLAPILLLLNQDTDFVSGFGDRQRYFPVTLAISGYLVLSALYRIWEEVWHGDSGWGIEIGGPGWFFVVKNAALLILTLPNHILFNRFMWDYAKQTDAMLLLTMPLNLPSIIITDIITVKVLGLLGIIYSLAQYLISRQIRIQGMKYI